MFFFLAWIGCAVMIGFIANERGRNGIFWGLLATLISPLLAGIALFLVKRDTFSDIAALADLEAKVAATPQGSHARKMFEERSEEYLAKTKADKASTWQAALARHPKKTASTTDSFTTFVGVWVVILLLGLCIAMVPKATPKPNINEVEVPEASDPTTVQTVATVLYYWNRCDGIKFSDKVYSYATQYANRHSEVATEQNRLKQQEYSGSDMRNEVMRLAACQAMATADSKHR